MATQWVLGKISNAIQPTVQSAVSTAGSFAGGAVNAVGSSINGVGESINTSIRAYGDGAKDYGNSIMDWTKAPTSRAQTAKNPLGLSDTTVGGKRGATSPSVYRAPPKSKTTPSETLTTTNKTHPPQKKTMPGQKSNGTVKASVASTNKPLAAKANTGQKRPPAPGAVPGSANLKKNISPQSKPVKASTANVTKAKVPKNSRAAANPLGLKE